MTDIKEAKSYLETGGLGEVLGLATVAKEMEQPKVQMDTEMAIALCILANEALNRRTAN
jgi:hypothetical protein